ncbi:MAG: hypothetical protein INH41_23530 [Myxococcaceae bacterium]|nr:hypothetical protein [Myxococcaceae bacterium]
MIKKTTALAALLALVPANGRALDLDERPFSQTGRQKRLALSVVGIGGAVTMASGVFFFVGRSGAALHLNPDGTLRTRGDLEEARAALTLQRVSLGALALGFATLASGLVLLVLSTSARTFSVAPAIGAGSAGVVVTVATD